MSINADATKFLIASLGSREAFYAVRLAKHVDTLEKKWKAKFDKVLKEATSQALESLEKTGKAKIDDEIFEEFFMNHFFEISKESFESTKTMPAIRMAKGMPRSLRDLMKLWDLWRKKKQMPPQQKRYAERVKKAYIDRAQKSWQKHSEDMREGKSADREGIVKSVQKEAQAPLGRADTIVNTETTRYWNTIRKETYDESEDVTHYLFVAIRDFRTTKWCKTRQGLVYEKDDPELKKGPPMHWNCRSEILPLTSQNPRHQALIDDKSKARRNRHPEPLPEGWSSH